MSKKEYLRKKFLKLRKKKYFDITSNFFKPLESLFKKNDRNLKSISIYYPTNYETNILKIFQYVFFKKFETSLPVILKKNTMIFYKWNNKEILSVNKFGILEPLKNGKNVVPKVMFLPLLAFDSSKNRLGYGKGYYDKFLNKYLKKNRKIITIGVAFSFQKYHKLPTSKFDVKLNYILTEKGLLR